MIRTLDSFEVLTDKKAHNKAMGQMCKVQPLSLPSQQKRSYNAAIKDKSMTTDSRRFSMMKWPCSSMGQHHNGNDLITLLEQRPSHCQWSTPETLNIHLTSMCHFLETYSIYGYWRIPYHGFCVPYLFRCKYLSSL